MILFRRPTAKTVRAFLAEQATRPVTYPSTGAATPPSGFDVDHTRIRLGTGKEVFAAASDALERWQHFQLGWVEALPNDTPIKEGAVVAVLARVLGAYRLNACRIVAVVNDDGVVRRFGFSYATLPDHVECGEERFMIEWHKQDGSVWYDILAFSRPRHLLVRLARPITRRLQKRFARQSAAAMMRAVDGRDGGG